MDDSFIIEYDYKYKILGTPYVLRHNDEIVEIFKTSEQAEYFAELMYSAARVGE